MNLSFFVGSYGLSFIGFFYSHHCLCITSQKDIPIRCANLFLTEKLQSSATIVAEDCSLSVRNKFVRRFRLSVLTCDKQVSSLSLEHSFEVDADIQVQETYAHHCIISASSSAFHSIFPLQPTTFLKLECSWVCYDSTVANLQAFHKMSEFPSYMSDFLDY